MGGREVSSSDLPIVVCGAGGHGKVVADMLVTAGARVLGFADDRRAVGEKVLGLPVVGPLASLEPGGIGIALGVGDNAARERVAAELVARGHRLVTAIHPSAVVSRFATIEEGAVLMALAVVNPDARIGRGAIVNTGAVVEHDCVVGPFAHVSPNGTLAGGCHLGELAHLGAGASMIPLTRVGDRSIVGGGAVVIRDLPADVVAAGVPARVLRHLIIRAPAAGDP